MTKLVDGTVPVERDDEQPCYHGGAFFEAIVPDFRNLENISDVINADVLDAWFPPAHAVITTLSEHLEWIARTSPPTASEGLISAISNNREVSPKSILPGAGSSDLIFLALPRLLSRSSRVLITDPSYGEYAHVLEYLVGCTITRLELTVQTNYQIDLKTLRDAIGQGIDMVILVNPNNPTGQHINRQDMTNLIQNTSKDTLFWIDETYIDYTGPEQSMEKFAAESPNVIVCKSMSKAYALSGLRVGYLCANSQIIARLGGLTPPWAVSLPAQIAAVKALEDPAYYHRRFQETNDLRKRFTSDLNAQGIEVISGIANFLLCRLPKDSIDVPTLLNRCHKHNLYLRDVSKTSRVIDHRVFRTAVKDTETNRKIIHIIATVMADE